MLIAKGGISREIDEENLQVYKDKGYDVVEEKPDKKKPAQEKKGE